MDTNLPFSSRTFNRMRYPASSSSRSARRTASRPSPYQAARRDDWGERVGDALTQLGWLGADDRAPLWAVGMAGEALERYAPVPSRPGHEEKRFAAILRELSELDEQLGDTQEDQSEWSRRNRLVREALLVGAQAGIEGGWALDHRPDSLRTVVYLDLPQPGLAAPRQVSWHVPDRGVPTWWPYYGEDWDGHTKKQKRERIRAYLARMAA